MNEMLPEERQIVKALNPWLRLNSPSFHDRDQHQSLYIKSLWRNNSKSTKKEKKKTKQLRMGLTQTHNSGYNAIRAI